MANAINGIGAAAMNRAGAIGQAPGRIGGTGQVPGSAGPTDSATGGSSFADTLKSALGEVSTLQENSQNAIQSFLRGEAVELHQVMAAAEEAGIALEMLVEVRNKLTDAYRSVMQMQS